MTPFRTRVEFALRNLATVHQLSEADVLDMMAGYDRTVEPCTGISDLPEERRLDKDRIERLSDEDAKDLAVTMIAHRLGRMRVA